MPNVTPVGGEKPTSPVGGEKPTSPGDGENATSPDDNHSNENSNNDAEKKVSLAALKESRYETREAKKKFLEASKRLEEYEQKEKAEKEEKMKKNGEFETLVGEKTKEIESLKKQVDDLLQYKQKHEEIIKDKINEAKKVIKKEDSELLESLLTGKSAVEQDALLPKLLDRFKGVKNVNASIAGGGTKNDVEAKIKILMEQKEEAKKGGKAMDVMRINNEIRNLQESKN